MRLAWILLAVLIISASPAWAEIDHSLTLPDFSRQSLLNGMEVIMFPTNQDTVPFLLLVKNGAAFDPVEKWGVTYLTARLIVEAGRDRSGQLILPALKAMGSEIAYKVEWDAIWFEGKAPASRLSETLNMLGQMIVQAEFDEQTFEAVRNATIDELEKQSGEPVFATQQVFLSELFDLNPYGHLVRGTPKTLRNIMLGDVKLQYRRLFMPNQAHLALCHTGDQTALFNSLTRRWGAWIKSTPLPFAFRKAVPPIERRVVILDRPLAEGVARCGTLSVARGDRNASALEILEQYLTLSLPGWARQIAEAQQVRAAASVETRIMPGFIQLSVQAPTDQVSGYLKKFDEALVEVGQGRMPRERFAEAKRLAFVEMRKSLADPLELMRKVLETSLYNVGVNYLVNYGLRIDRFTPELFQKAVKEHFDKHPMVVVVAGPAEILQSPMAGFGQVRLLK